MIAFWQLRIDTYSTQFVWILPIMQACIFFRNIPYFVHVCIVDILVDICSLSASYMIFLVLA
jgi:hypothetical protein